MKKVLLLSFFLGIVCFCSNAHAKSNYELALTYKYQLSLMGMNYDPWKDRLDNDVILMSKLLSLDRYDVNKIGGSYQIISTKRKTYVNNKKKLVILNNKSTLSELISLLFTRHIQKASTGVELIYGNQVKSIEPVRKDNPYVYSIDIPRK